MVKCNFSRNVPLESSLLTFLVCPQGVPDWCESVEHFFKSLQLLRHVEHFQHLFSAVIWLNNCTSDPKCTILKYFLNVASDAWLWPVLVWKCLIFLITKYLMICNIWLNVIFREMYLLKVVSEHSYCSPWTTFKRYVSSKITFNQILCIIKYFVIKNIKTFSQEHRPHLGNTGDI